MNMASRTCASCEVNWPVSGFGVCPVCQSATHYSRNRAVSSTQVDSLVNAMKFERYYEQRERERIARNEPSPEELGSKDAADEIKRRKGE